MMTCSLAQIRPFGKYLMTVHLNDDLTKTDWQISFFLG